MLMRKQLPLGSNVRNVAKYDYRHVGKQLVDIMQSARNDSDAR